MCGICGMTAPGRSPALQSMLVVTVHRGPDDGGTYLTPDGAVGLGSRRLSIIDLSSAGHMPMMSDDGRVAVAYNGEIYNYRELRERSSERPGTSSTPRPTPRYSSTDTRSGALELFARLNGIFALALWDAREHRLLLARDRFGVKPLYHTVDDSWAPAGSPLKSRASSPAATASPPDPPGYPQVPGLPVGPGARDHVPRGAEAAAWALGRVARRPARARAGTGHPTSLRLPAGRWTAAEAAAELREILESTVSRQLVADVPVGVFLSGGLDSTALAALATRLAGRPPPASPSASEARTPPWSSRPTTPASPAWRPTHWGRSCTTSKWPPISSICCPR